MNTICGIYKITNKINNKVYIGKAINIYKRWIEHKNNMKYEKYNQIIYKAMRKYGIENFSFEIIEECDKYILDEREKYWIRYYNSYIGFSNSNGYNMTIGGEGVLGNILSKESKIKISESLHGMFSGGNNPRAKKVICDNIVFNCIKDCSEYYNESYDSMSKWLNKKVKMPKYWFNKGLRFLDCDISEYEISQNSVKKVYCDGLIFNSIKECANYYNVRPGNMNRWLNGSRKMPQEFIDMNLKFYEID